MVNTAPINPERVSVFIDHTNVFYSIKDLRKIDKNWIKHYDPLQLANKLIGNRQLQGVYFYCAPPPTFYLQDGPDWEKKYWEQMSYYNEVQKLPNVNLWYARLTGTKGDLHEKGLDTKLNTDLVVMASQNLYDTAIIISNDGDYFPGIEGVKQLGRKIELAYFKGMCSMSTRQLCDVPRRLRRSHFIELPFAIKTSI